MPDMWMITSGSYSDYEVHGVVEDKELGERIVEQMNEGKRGNYNLEDVPVVTEVHREYVLRMEYRNKQTLEWTTSYWRFAEGVTQKCETHEAWHGGVVVSGTDHERVRKVFSEKRAELIAQQEGLTS